MFRVKFGSKVVDGADQIWTHVLGMPASQGVEIPISRDRHNPMMLALFVLLKLHPEARIGVRQSRSILVTRTEEGMLRVSQDARASMVKGNQFLRPEDFANGIEQLIASQDGFLRGQGLDPQTQADLAQKDAYDRRQKHEGGHDVRVRDAVAEASMVDAAAQVLTSKNIEEAVKAEVEKVEEP